MGRKIIDLTGQRFGRLVVQNLRGMEDQKAVWNCLCDCGKSSVVRSLNLRRGGTKSCGCFRREASAERVRTHGQTRSPTYLTWVSMLQRCENPEATGYEYYGGRGISVCETWHSFESFLADMGNRPARRTLDRIDPDGNYEKNNCRWATSTEQAANRRKRKS